MEKIKKIHHQNYKFKRFPKLWTYGSRKRNARLL